MYQKYYHNRRMNAVVQDAFLGRGTKSPYLAILNHIGLVCDENAPRSVSDEFMAAVGPNQAIMDLEEELVDLIAAGDDEGITRVRSQLRAARQKHRRETVAAVRTTHFKERNAQELDRQMQGIHLPPPPVQQITFTLPERRRIATILSDLNEDLSEEQVRARGSWRLSTRGLPTPGKSSRRNQGARHRHHHRP